MQTQSFTGFDVRALGARGVGGNIVGSERGANVSLRKKHLSSPNERLLAAARGGPAPCQS